MISMMQTHFVMAMAGSKVDLKRMLTLRAPRRAQEKAEKQFYASASATAEPLPLRVI